MHDIFNLIKPKHYLKLTGGPVLTLEEVEELIKIFNKFPNCVIWGGDVLTDKFEYTYDNWFYEPCETQNVYEMHCESCLKANKYIKNYIRNDGDNFLFIFVIEDM